jgi:hypothetical protein
MSSPQTQYLQPRFGESIVRIREIRVKLPWALDTHCTKGYEFWHSIGK